MDDYKVKTIEHWIETYVSKFNMSYMDAILHYCEEKGIQPDSIATKLPKPIIEKFTAEASKMNLIKDKYEEIPLDESI